MDNNFSEWLQKKLDDKGWQQVDLAKRSGVSTSQISRAMSGQRGLSEYSLNRIAAALNVSPEETFRAVGFLQKVGVNKEYQDQLMHLVGQLTDEDKERLLVYIQVVMLGGK